MKTKVNMSKEELFNQIQNSDGNLRISSVSSTEEGEEVIALAKHLELEGKIVLLEYCLDKKPLAVSLKTKNPD
ncbi:MULTISPECIES: hypothetical protein [Mesobacillus]|uniref:Uncharacterized protein n=1 Tax=Mesobacillus selenatarsenatis (strain DSM 18680 / JCM 14380 / FERM P-15431 / SF-1) TaxID=1321606 RepID=A0A0A8X1N3_MESS1|nr:MULTISPECIES: hypothetical protein [Mesobacillus]GAM13184.1 hypothetical protein SAMD00020551_1322 [Mesobacillus selenatarsenatis SF-1]